MAWRPIFYVQEENLKRVLTILKFALPILLAVVLLQMVSVTDSQAAPPASGGVNHMVRFGETLFSIGRLYGVNPYSIAQANGLHNPNRIYAGQMLYIPARGGWSDCGACGCGQPCYQPKPQPQPCHGQTCYQPKPQPQTCHGHACQHPTYGHGYDNTGYYYWNGYPDYRRYSYTCGYHFNCY